MNFALQLLDGPLSQPSPGRARLSRGLRPGRICGAACHKPSARSALLAAACRCEARGRLRGGASRPASARYQRSPRTAFLLAVVFIAVLAAALPALSAQGKDYLTQIEADKIRDAETPAERIKLFAEFAADRLAKFKYELSRGHPDRQRVVRLRSLLDGYMGSLDDAAELVEIGRMRQQDILKGIEELEKHAIEFLAEIEALDKSTSSDAGYKDDLHDAVLATKEALAEVARAKDEIAPPPVRRKP